jgi:hypothetical protein
LRRLFLPARIDPEVKPLAGTGKSVVAIAELII